MDVEKQLYDRVVAGFRTIIRVASGTMPESAITEAHRKLFFTPEERSFRTKRRPAASGFLPTQGKSPAWNMVVKAMAEGGIYVGSCPSTERYLAFLFFCHRFLEQLDNSSAKTTAMYLRHLLSWDGKAWKGYHDDKVGGLSYVIALAQVSIANRHVFTPLFGGSVPSQLYEQDAGTSIHFNELQWGPIRSFFHPLVFLRAVEMTSSDQDARNASKPKKLWRQVEMDPSLTWTPLSMGVTSSDRINLSGERFYGALIEGWNTKELVKINLKNARFHWAQITRCDLSSCMLDGAVFYECFLKQVRFGLDIDTARSLRASKLTADRYGTNSIGRSLPAIATGKKYDSEISNLAFIGCRIVECAIDCATVKNLLMERCRSHSLYIMDSYIRGFAMRDCLLELPDIRRVHVGSAVINNCALDGMITTQYWTNWEQTHTIEDLHIDSGSMKDVLIQRFVAGMVDESFVFYARGARGKTPLWTSTLDWIYVNTREVSVENVEMREICMFYNKRVSGNGMYAKYELSRIAIDEKFDRMRHLVEHAGFRFSREMAKSGLLFLKENVGAEEEIFTSPQYRS
jgi:hypothetical protein